MDVRERVAGDIRKLEKLIAAEKNAKQHDPTGWQVWTRRVWTRPSSCWSFSRIVLPPRASTVRPPAIRVFDAGGRFSPDVKQCTQIEQPEGRKLGMWRQSSLP